MYLCVGSQKKNRERRENGQEEEILQKRPGMLSNELKNFKNEIRYLNFREYLNRN